MVFLSKWLGMLRPLFVVDKACLPEPPSPFNASEPGEILRNDLLQEYLAAHVLYSHGTLHSHVVAKIGTVVATHRYLTITKRKFSGINQMIH